jgi:hypothetical protein
MRNSGDPTFDQVYRALQQHGQASIVSSKGTLYQVTAEMRRGLQVIIARPRRGEVRVHADCWGDDITCQGTRAGGIFNGSPSIYDWYRGTLGTRAQGW